MFLTVFVAACQNQTHSPAPDVANASEKDFPVMAEYQSFVIETNEESREKGTNNAWDLHTTRLRGIVHVIENGQKPVFDFQPCSVSLPEMTVLHPSIANETIQRSKAVRVTGEWLQDADGKFTLHTPKASLNLAGDLEMDGAPGVTVSIAFGKLYMNLSGSMMLEGTFDNGIVTGPAAFDREMAVIGDNAGGMLKSKYEQSLTTAETRAVDASVEMRPIGASQASCGAL